MKSLGVDTVKLVGTEGHLCFPPHFRRVSMLSEGEKSTFKEKKKAGTRPEIKVPDINHILHCFNLSVT